MPISTRSSGSHHKGRKTGHWRTRRISITAERRDPDGGGGKTSETKMCVLWPSATGRNALKIHMPGVSVVDRIALLKAVASGRNAHQLHIAPVRGRPLGEPLARVHAERDM
jgi:hypothetical protein